MIYCGLSVCGLIIITVCGHGSVMCLVVGLDNDPYQAFVAFHDNGYTIYEPTRCHGYRHVPAEFSVLAHPQQSVRLVTNLPTWQRLCPSATETSKCDWGNAVNVQNKFIYASQPALNRLVVIDIRDHHSPVEVSKQYNIYSRACWYVRHCLRQDV